MFKSLAAIPPVKEACHSSRMTPPSSSSSNARLLGSLQILERRARIHNASALAKESRRISIQGVLPSFFQPLHVRELSVYRSQSKRSKSQQSHAQRHDFPVLREFGRLIKNGLVPMRDTALIGVQHMMPSTTRLFERVQEDLGIPIIKLVGKHYSTCPGVEEELRQIDGLRVFNSSIPKKPGQFQEQMTATIKLMWDELKQDLIKDPTIKRIIVLDEGGHCIAGMPKDIGLEYSCAAIEQTRFGLYGKSEHTFLFPLIDVARSAAKCKLEAPLIAQAVVRRAVNAIVTLGISNSKVCGVIGNGAIGSALTKRLLKDGFKVIVYDSNDDAFHDIANAKCYRVDSIKKVVANSDVVFGCTGKDISADKEGLITNYVTGPITFVSCSSKDIEFYSLLKEIAQRNSLQQNMISDLSLLQFTTPNSHEVTILENGFPINFDRTPFSDPPVEMELTRCLLFGAIAQAGIAATKPNDDGKTLNTGHAYHMLDPYLQYYIANRWLERESIKNMFTKNLRECFADFDWIRKNSTGAYVGHKLFKTLSNSYTSLPLRLNQNGNNTTYRR